MLKDPAAPSPVIPTYRPSKQPSGPSSKLTIMSTVALTDYKQYARIPALRKPRPRSAGASSRPMRSENIAELVRFFQTPEDTEEAPEVVSQIDSKMDLLKAGQRRLRDMGQTKSGRASIKSFDTSSSSEKTQTRTQNQNQHLIALQREGLLSGLEGSSSSNKSRSSRSKHAKHDIGGSLPSLEDLADNSRPSRTKQDVEAIGRPWLDDALSLTQKSEERSISQFELPLHDLRSGSLSLGDLSALVEFSASFPELYPHDSDPPPYQARDQSQLPARTSSLNDMAAPNPEDHDRNEVTHQLGNEAESSSRDSRSEADNLASNKPAQDHHVAINQQPQSGKPDTDKNDDNSSCESNSDFDDAKSLAVLLRATERLGLGKKKGLKKAPSGEPSSGTANVAAAATTTTSTSTITTTPAAVSVKSNPVPHSLNQGVTDTPLFIRSLIENKHDVAEAAQKVDVKGPKGTDQLLPLSQVDANLPTQLNAGPIPLKLVAECLPSSNSKQVSAHLLNSSVPRPTSRLNDEINQLQLPSTTVGISSANFPRPRALLSPIPIQTRRARSVTPDVASSMHAKGKKKGKKAQLYVLTDAAPLPPPAKPLPSLPQSADALSGAKTVSGDRSVSTPAQPASAPVEYREEDRDSPVLGMNPRKLQLQKGYRPSSRFSNRSIDASDASRNSGDDQSLRTTSPSVSRPESQEGRANQVHAIRMRDIDAKKKKDSPKAETTARLGSGTHPMKHDGPYPYQSQHESGQNDQVRFSNRNRISTVPEFPLPKNPPLNAQGMRTIPRRNSTTSLPGSISTMNGYEGGLSRSVSVTSGSIDSLSIKHGKTARLSADAASKSLSHSNFQPESPLLPSSDEEGHDPRTRGLKNNRSKKKDNDGSESRQMNHRLPNSKSKQSIRNNATLKHENLPSASEVLQPAFPTNAGDSGISYVNVLHHLESRIATLERQNKMLQAALLAALDVGVSRDASSAQSRSTSPTSSSMRIPTINERTMPSPNSNQSVDSARQKQGKAAAQRHYANGNLYVHDALSQGRRASFETTSSHSDVSMRPVEGTLRDLDAGRWNEAIRKSRR